MDFTDTVIGLLIVFLVMLFIWAISCGLSIRNKYKTNPEADNTAEAIVNHLRITYPNFFTLGVGKYFRTVGVIELNVLDIPALKRAFAKRCVTLVDAGPEAAVDGFHMELAFAGNTIGVKAYRNIN